MMSTESLEDPTTTASANGVAPSDDAITAPLRAHVADLRTRHEAAAAEAKAIAAELVRYERALATLDGTTPRRTDRGPAPTDGDAPRRGRPPGRGTTIGKERMDAIERTIREIAAERDDFTQVEVRARTGVNSGVTAVAFERLRADGVIRLSRREGNLKVFRLTQEALASAPDAASETDEQ